MLMAPGLKSEFILVACVPLNGATCWTMFPAGLGPLASLAPIAGQETRKKQSPMGPAVKAGGPSGSNYYAGEGQSQV